MLNKEDPKVKSKATSNTIFSFFFSLSKTFSSSFPFSIFLQHHHRWASEAPRPEITEEEGQKGH
jgi:hypothetical protein